VKRWVKNFFIDQQKGKRKLSEKAYIFLFCLLLSTFFWLLTALSKEYSTSLSLPVEYTALSDQFVLTSEPQKFLNLEVRGTGFQLLGQQWSLDDQRIEVDLNAAKPHYEEGLYFLKTTELRNKVIQKIDHDLSLRYISPDTLYFHTALRKSKKVPVVFDHDLTYASGYRLRSDFTVSPDSVTVSGPAYFIDSLTFIKTEKKTSKNLEDSLTLQLQMVADKEVGGVMVEPARVNILVPVEKFTEKKLTLTIIPKSEVSGIDLKTFPDEVLLTLIVPLSKYEYVDSSIVKANVHYTSEKKEYKKLKVEVEGLPPYASILKSEPEKVEFIIRK
jgi:hypothetical protein